MAKFDSTLLPEDEKDRRVVLDLLDKINKVSEDVGAVTPAYTTSANGIYESGSNANGYYVKYVDGTMECWLKSDPGGASSYVWTFPAPFAESPFVSGSILADTNAANTSFQFSVHGSSVSPTTVTMQKRYDNGTPVGYVGGATYYAIGKWNLDRRVVPSGTLILPTRIALTAPTSPQDGDLWMV